MSFAAQSPQSRGRSCSIFYFCNVGWFFVSHRLALARAAKERGYDVHVLCDVETSAEIATIEAAGLRFHRVHLSRGGLNPLADLRLLLRMVALLLRHRPAVLHNVTIKPVLYGSLAARLVGTSRVVNAISGLGYLFIDAERSGVALRVVRTIYRLALRNAAVRVIFQNEDDRREFVSQRLVQAEQSVLIAGSGVDLARYSAVPEPERGPIRIVLPARLLSDKGIREFVSAAEALKAGGLAIECVLAGSLDPSNRAALTAADVAVFESKGAVKWLGHVEDMPRLLRESHIVCLPSYREGLPKALIEACAASRPIVTTDVPGCRAVVRDGVNGLLVPPRDAEALRVALARLATDRALRVKMGMRGREIAEKEYDLAHVIDATLRLYPQVAS